MELNGTTIYVVGSAIAAIIWLIRLEGKVKETHKLGTDNAVDIKAASLALATHIANTEVHHNAQAFSEFEKRIDDRFQAFKESLNKVEGYVEDMDQKLDRALEKK